MTTPHPAELTEAQHQTPSQTVRDATPNDPPCSCGLPARVVYLTDKFGEVSSCR